MLLMFLPWDHSSCSGQEDHNGADWTVNSGEISGVHCNVAKFVIPASASVSVKAWDGTENSGKVEVYAEVWVCFVLQIFFAVRHLFLAKIIREFCVIYFKNTSVLFNLIIYMHRAGQRCYIHLAILIIYIWRCFIIYIYFIYLYIYFIIYLYIHLHLLYIYIYFIYTFTLYNYIYAFTLLYTFALLYTFIYIYFIIYFIIYRAGQPYTFGDALFWCLNYIKYQLILAFSWSIVIAIPCLFTKLPWPGDSEGTFRSSSQAAITCPPVNYRRWRLHTLPFNAERQVGKLRIPFFIVLGLTRPGSSPLD